MEELFGCKTVQEVLIQEEQVPEKYFHKVEDGGVPVPDDSPPQLLDVPVIDLALLADSSITADEFEKLRSALDTLGCFQVINHGIAPEFLDVVREITKQFFALPVEDKKKYLREGNDVQGYGNDVVYTEQQKLDWTDRLYLTVFPQDSRKLKRWPENPESFRRTLDQFATEIDVVTKTVLKAMTRSLGLEHNCFSDLYGNMDIRFNFYPPCPRPDLVLGFKPHSDSSLITHVLQDKEVEGLQFLKGDEWFRAPIVPDALLIIVGDQVEMLSNGVFKGAVHKVVIHPDKERISVAAFCYAESYKIEPFERLVDESRPRLYRKMENYGDIFMENYQNGRRTIEEAKIYV
ncbi:protein SRG1 [Pyrus x bretschneideri]|uniref:protein SRG1 n=1 Tax=Pyrus x bretschneideri TaxID=225117 RepID=UPI000510DAE6|nr:protein SRG1 [Pyrus x bretschneideri]XP_009363942.1 protein SRG1 [Pyrus x bretschneideri]XP_048422963.1 protein SRG1 [Pyrus x bretschneideri]